MSKSIYFVLPNRIGDAILSLPAVLCFKQLNDLAEPELKKEITIFPPDSLFEIIWSLKICKTLNLEEIIKVHSWFKPLEEVFSWNNSTQLIGLKAKQIYGEKVKSRWVSQFYTKDLKYLDLDKTAELLDPELIRFLKEEKKLSLASIRYFGCMLDLGYTTEQIKKVFDFDTNSFALPAEGFNGWEPNLIKNNYIVFSMEAAYGRKHEAKRRWNEENYFKIAEYIYEKHGLISVFIGLEKLPLIPSSAKYIIDQRNKLTTVQLAQLMLHSKGYIGNDTGPLHLANLLKKPSVCIYLSTLPENYGPIFPQLNFPIIQPTNPDETFKTIEDYIREANITNKKQVIF